MKSLAFASIDELKQSLERKEISPLELVEFYQKRFAKHDSELGSALEVFDAHSIMQNQVEIENGALHGIPGLIKDNICQKGRSLTCASKILQKFMANYDATVVAKLKAAGALLIGRANMDEFAMGSSNE